ncbi:MAG: hypothetical protein R3C45_00350 [Phycisphaerales bacterium]
MRLECANNRPSLLMFSDCLPDPEGDKRSARAWRLLNCATATHQVYLSVGAGRPVNLKQWRCVAQRVRRVHITPSNRPWFVPPTIPSEFKTLLQQKRFDVLLATSPRVWPGRYDIDARLKLCDFANDIQDTHTHAGPVGRWAATPWPARLRELGRAKTSPIIELCDHVIVASDAQALALPGRQNKAVTIPDSSTHDAWAKLFAPASDDAPATSTLTVLPVKPIAYRQAA